MAISVSIQRLDEVDVMRIWLCALVYSAPVRRNSSTVQYSRTSHSIVTLRYIFLLLTTSMCWWDMTELWSECWSSVDAISHKIWFCGCNIHKIVSDLIWTMNFTIIIYKCSCSVQSVAKHHIANHQSSFPGHILDLVGTVKFTFWFTCCEWLLGWHGHVTAINTCIIDIKCEISLVNLFTIL